MTNRPAVPPPPPRSISEEARTSLAMHFPPPVYPPLGDTQGWLDHVRDSNGTLIQAMSAMALPVHTQHTKIADVPAYVLRAEGVADDEQTPVYLDIHGGALIVGTGEACRLMTTPDAVTTGMITWAVDYRVPPLHPYPAALDDCLAVYRALLEVRAPQDIFVGGGSAGGNLAAALLLRAGDEGLPMPAALALLTPEADLTESGDSFETLKGIDPRLSSLREVNLLYAGGHDLTHPYLSPLFGDLSGFPPTFLQTGTRDLFLSNTVRMHRKLRAAGVEAELHVFEAMPHGGFGGAPEDAEIGRELRRFLDRHRRDRQENGTRP
ncbi:alpha/beta hydrolase [Streptomyces sp. NPDC048291]|uniref:alpha/beta hydrolase n=1 Tax=Streptomyces sp. NPDC048291 TaxID=3365530 RepID=UPI003712E7BA